LDVNLTKNKSFDTKGHAGLPFPFFKFLGAKVKIVVSCPKPMPQVVDNALECRTKLHHMNKKHAAFFRVIVKRARGNYHQL
jgi:hypothetical protein